MQHGNGVFNQSEHKRLKAENKYETWRSQSQLPLKNHLKNLTFNLKSSILKKNTVTKHESFQIA